jgi:hypothetical protein
MHVVVDQRKECCASMCYLTSFRVGRWKVAAWVVSWWNDAHLAPYIYIATAHFVLRILSEAVVSGSDTMNRRFRLLMSFVFLRKLVWANRVLIIIYIREKRGDN